MSSTKKTINEHLGLLQEAYEMEYFVRYFNWCESVTISQNQFQRVLANSMIDNWYNMEFEKCEAEFLSIIKDYPTAPIEAKKTLYDKCVVRMFTLFPKPILDDVLKGKNNMPMFSVGKFKVDSQFLNLN